MGAAFASDAMHTDIEVLRRNFCAFMEHAAFIILASAEAGGDMPDAASCAKLVTAIFTEVVDMFNKSLRSGGKIYPARRLKAGTFSCVSCVSTAVVVDGDEGRVDEHVSSQ